jgi:hypothetical protein
MHKTTCHHELGWTAFCYAAGELTGAEAEAFELRLADDQAAREALARAVELTQAVAAAETMEPVSVGSRGRSTWGRRVVWMAIGSAASLLVAAFVSQLDLTRDSRDDRELAAAWSQTRQELSVASDANHWPAEDQEAETADEDLDLIATPDWMTAAVRGSIEMPEDGPATPDEPEPTDGDSTPFDGDSREN